MRVGVVVVIDELVLVSPTVVTPYGIVGFQPPTPIYTHTVGWFSGHLKPILPPSLKTRNIIK